MVPVTSRSNNNPAINNDSFRALILQTRSYLHIPRSLCDADVIPVMCTAIVKPIVIITSPAAIYYEYKMHGCQNKAKFGTIHFTYKIELLLNIHTW